MNTIKCIQVNLNNCKVAQDLLYATANEQDSSLLFVSEYYSDSGNNWYYDKKRKATIVNLTRFKPETVDGGEDGFVRAEISGIQIYSCYWSPNTSIDLYEDFFSRLEISIRYAGPNILITGDFNAKHSDWGSSTNDVKGQMLSNLMWSLDFQTCNVGSTNTFQAGSRGSVIDVTFASSALASRIHNWKVLDEITLSDHKYIAFHITLDRAPIRAASPRRNLRRLNRSTFEENIKNLPSQPYNEASAELEAERLVREIKSALDASAPLHAANPRRKSVHWWSPELGILQKHANHLRRVLQRKKVRVGPDACTSEEEEARNAKLALVKAIKLAKKLSWKLLCDQVDKDPWGLPYKIVMGKLGRKPLAPNFTGSVQDTIRDLFPIHPPRVMVEPHVS